ncbi:hybrid sensor histidine kinase/response regulator transcription factor [Bacteroides sp. 51]|uniref:hybrid sensor histidine kinase/response regulator transcription factor n=1 Tax=Bacteroides sp. 51 TaxID=2302938 RepID=UPI0013D2BD03|nr:hybrid sensor histidine kinase/response regulator transcription factor [Bacteroides sp. 51]NDV80393.1 hybrid sensor histidine kinase/response regulator [Bacteroides sp. 51]
MKRTFLISAFALIASITPIAPSHGMTQPICDINEYTIKDGLAQSIVTGLLQDKKGFMWLSTWDGLNKFDGYTFKKYKSMPGDGSTLINNRLQSIAESQYNDIWCLTYLSRVYLFDSGTEKFIDVLGPLETERQQAYVARKIRSLAKGVAWILCDNGYCFRIDEKEIKQGAGITIYSTFNNTIKGENVYNVYQDADGDEWVLTNKGATIVGQKTINSDFPFQTVTEVNGDIWLTRPNGKLAKYDRKTSTPQFIEMPPYLNRINDIIVLDDHTLAIGSNEGVILFDTQKSTFKQISVLTNTQKNNYVTQLSKDRFGEVWAFTQEKGVTRINLENNEIQHFYTPLEEAIHFERENVPRVFEDAIGVLWVLPRDGNLSYYNRDTKELEYYYTNPNDPQSVFQPHMRHLCIDRQGNVWFSSLRGVSRMSSSAKNYEQIDMDRDMDIRAFLRDSQNNFWIASKSGKIRIFDKHKNFKGYLSRDGKITQGANSFQHSAYCFMEDRDGNIWIGSRYNGIYLLKKNKGTEFAYTISNYAHDPEDRNSLSSNSVYSIYQDNNKQIWIGSYLGGINLVNYDEQNNIHFIHYGNQLKNYPSTYMLKVRYITQIGDSIMMAGTTDGLLTFSSDFNHPEEIKFYRNFRKPEVKNNISSNDVMQIFVNQKEIYLITFSGGINKITSNNLLSENIDFKAYTEQNGLISDLTLSMVKDQIGNLWVVSENGLSLFDPVHETFENYDRQFLPENVYFSEAIPGVLATGQIVFGTNHGILEIMPDKIHKSDYVPLIVFTNMRIHGSDLYPDIDNQEKIVLSPKQRNITLRFAALDFRNSNEISYTYRLKGLEDEWNNVDKNRSASYLNIPKGTYNFEVRSTNSDGVWVENTRTLTIEVLPTFWETAWAWALYFTLFIMLTGTIVYVLFYIYRLRHRINMEQQLSNIKLRFFTDISHELRTPLTLISTPVTEVLEHEPLTPTAQKHLLLVQKNTNRMLELINQILDFRKIQNKKMKVLVEETEVSEQLHKIASCFQHIAKEKHIEFDIPNSTKSQYLWVDRDKFEKIFYNLLSNAFKYTPSGKKITIEITNEPGHITISVIDEGIGIQPQKLGVLFQRFETLANRNMLQASSGIGLSLVRELVELHHGNIEVTSVPDKGSAFKVKFPTGNEHFKSDEQAEFILSDDIQQTEIQNDKTQTTTLHHLHDEIDEERESINSSQDKLSVLIVEDNDELRKFLHTILSHQYNILEATNGQEGLNSVIQHVPDLVISDIMMPVMDGLDMVGHIKKNMDICHIPIVLLSAKSALDDRIKGLEYGIDDYITKPFSATYLKTRINSLLKQRKLLQERYLAAFTDKQGLPLNISPSEPQITPFDEIFLKQAVQFVEDNIDKTEMTIDDFANALKVSRTAFYRKLKTIVGLSPVDFIREIRVKRSAQLIDSGEYTFSQIAYMCGFNDPKYFTKCFKKKMGVTPSEYKESKILRN